MLNVLLGALIVEAFLLYLCDRGMKINRAEGVSEDAVRVAPLYWERPELFSSRGNRYRRAALVIGIAMLLTGLAAVLSADIPAVR